MIFKKKKEKKNKLFHLEYSLQVRDTGSRVHGLWSPHLLSDVRGRQCLSRCVPAAVPAPLPTRPPPHRGRPPGDAGLLSLRCRSYTANLGRTSSKVLMCSRFLR